MKLFFGIANEEWHGKPIPAGLELFCVSPLHGRSARTRKENKIPVIPGAKYILDSGAFCDDPANRLTFTAAWQRQIDHAEKYGYMDNISHIVAYDLLIDEWWQDGIRSKHRWTESAAREAVEITVAAAQYARQRRDNTLSEKGLILPVQGVTPDQYATCAEKTIPHIDPETDILGLGGWCIIGMYRTMLGGFKKTLQKVMPMAAHAGIQRVHIFGVMYPPALGMLQYYADQHGIEVSTDSSSPVMKTTRGEWGYGDDWQKLESIKHLSLVEKREWRYWGRVQHCFYAKEWAGRLRDSQYYGAGKPVQKTLWEAMAA